MGDMGTICLWFQNTLQHTIGQELPSYITYFDCLLTIFCTSLILLSTLLVVGWLNLITHPLFACHKLYNLGVPIGSRVCFLVVNSRGMCYSEKSGFFLYALNYLHYHVHFYLVHVVNFGLFFVLIFKALL
jgi:hypothetical protein